MKGTKIKIEIVNGKERSYQLQQQNKIGSGSFGTVYQYLNFAIKKIQNVSRYEPYLIQRQVGILSKVDHPNLVKVEQIILTHNNIYIVMQLCETNLRAYMSRVRSQVEVAVIMNQIARGYKQLYELGVVHRDLKPQNILVKNGCFKIADFGTARFNSQDGFYKSIVGTTLYMPVQFLQKKQYTYKCDIWSLGIILYQLLFYRRPWNGSNQKSLLSHIKEGIPLPKEGISPLAKKILQRMLSNGEKQRMDIYELQSYFDIYQDSLYKREKKYHKSKIIKMLKIQFNHFSRSKYSADFNHLYPSQQAAIKKYLIDAQYHHFYDLNQRS